MLGVISGHGAGCTIEFYENLYEKIIKKYRESYEDSHFPQILTLTSGMEIISSRGVEIFPNKIKSELRLIEELLPKDKITHITLLCNSLNSNQEYSDFLENNYKYLDITHNYNRNEETIILCSEITKNNKLYGTNEKYTYISCEDIIYDCLLRRNKENNIKYILEEYKDYENIFLGCTELSFLFKELKELRKGVHDSIDLLTNKIIGELEL